MTEVATANERIKAQAAQDRQKAIEEAKQMSNLIEELGKLLKDKQTQLAEKVLALDAGLNDFLKFGSELEGYGKRYVKFSDKADEHGFGEGSKYFGEWSEATKKPHGRGIRIYTSGNILIGYYNNGGLAPGNYLTIYSNGTVYVGEYY